MTKSFLLKAHDAFDAIGFRPISPSISFEQFRNQAVKTLNHTKELEDGVEAIKCIRYLVRNFDRIASKIRKKYDFWKAIPHKGNKKPSLVSGDDAFGTYYVTNYLDSWKKVFVSSHSFGDDRFISVNYRSRKFGLDFSDIEYWLRFSRISYREMIILDVCGKKQCVINMNDDLALTLVDNNTEFEIADYQGLTCIYSKKYIASLNGKMPEFEHLLGAIEWDIPQEKDECGLARLEVYDDGADIELFLLFAVSILLLYKSLLAHVRSSFLTPLAFRAGFMMRR